ncbi:uncharacterized protein N0V89_004004 [Didymosphaeria variabile]|uniref:Luciferase domain-containing protein n=1 Tax=Didymosphaeria variabile TaxID=1932322 RepID=A0A9W8XPF2_9PLEO|nr:uncharacterized protein N0V89_004004 [Didymosphaeria variabile]KAJ4355979.1 hypothetical protein N0V89_004004 [Didymosphaeria variabile]
MSDSPVLSRFAHLANLEQLQRLLRSHRATIFSAAGAAVLLSFAIRDYHLYLSYGPGGLPYNAFGWLLANTLRVFSREQLSPKPYDDKKLPFADESGYLPTEFPPKRESPRPKLGSHPVPQRQLEQLPSADVRQELIDRFKQLGRDATEKGLVEVKQSLYERQHKALFVSSARHQHAVAQQTRGEISHVHAGLDGSVHVVLHPVDCKIILERGWGQRHAFSGADLNPVLPVNIPINYLLS